MSNKNKIQLGKILLKQKAVDAQELDSLLKDQRGQRLASKALEEGLLDETQVLKALSEQHGIPAASLNEIELRLSNLDMIPKDIAVKHMILPMVVTEDAITLAMANPEDQRVIDEIEFVSGKRVFPHVALHAHLVKVIERAYAAKESGDIHVYRTDRFSSVDQARPYPKSEDSDVLQAPGTVIADREEDSMELVIEVDVPEEEELKPDPKKAPPVPMPSMTATPPVPPTPEKLVQKTILVVDDEDDIRLLFSRVLTEKGYHVITASRGLEAIKKVQSETPSMIILDAMLPEIHGFDICRRIKGSTKYGHIPVIMISAIYRGWRYAQDLKNSYGVDEFIEKPFKINELVKKVTHLMESESQNEPPPQEELSKEAEKILTQCIAAYKSGNIEDAITLLKQGIDIDPLAFKLHYQLALLLGKKNMHYQAIRSLETALELQPDYFPALKNLAVLYQKTGFKFKAIETWEKAHGYCDDDKMKETIKTHLMNLL